uniref:Putative ribonuclease H-like domain-containing protein n=1 Tax=Tanacetum cinerariifolium TaxID=118510 RepID=A0A699RBB5_TANCI|nr:putative ribonuclease H-like domain-containing protein [Tanacetum cinerariifolium]
MDFTVYQMDAKSAFLYGTIEEEVYVSQPLGFMDPEFPDRVYKVEKALYGLHQAPKAWYETLSTHLLDNRFRRGIIDKNLFIKKIKNNIVLVQVTKTVETTGPVNTATPTYANYPNDPLMPDLKDAGILDDTYDDKDGVQRLTIII